MKDEPNLQADDMDAFDETRLKDDGKRIKSDDAKKKKKKQPHWVTWPIKAFFLTLLFSTVFSVISELVISNVSQIIFVVLLLLCLIAISIFFDLIGLAFAVCDIKPFYSLASKKIRGAKESIALLNKANVVSSICGDIIGDICGIVSGASGAGLVIKLAVQDQILSFGVSIVISSLIAAVTISGKAIAKHFAMQNSHEIVRKTGKFIAVITFKRR